eukprot:TRINITY_DN933_c0_g1_i1.p1 TRINITY_DN933_c0_g1~~TRINITY_DN933_c0_g1_i1.p1  ORF type:complete len:1121 (-),score=413.89 TRINITY_DN933_c0_g1_i1:102-3464(-)
MKRLKQILGQKKVDASPEILELTRILELERTHLALFSTRLATQQEKSGAANIEHGRMLADALHQYGTVVVKEEDGALLGNCLMEVAEVERHIQDSRADLSGFLSKVEAQVSEFVNSEMEAGRVLKKKYDKAKAAADKEAKKKSKNNKDKADEDEDEEDEDVDKIDEVEEDTAKQLAELTTAASLRTLVHMCQYADSLTQHYANIMARLSKAQPQIDKYKKQAQQQVEDYERITGKPLFVEIINDYVPAVGGPGVPLGSDAKKRAVVEFARRLKKNEDLLRMVVRNYQAEFKTNKLASRVPETDIGRIFGNASELYAAHTELFEAVQASMAHAPGSRRTLVSTALAQHLPKFNAQYLKYIANLGQAVDTLQKYERTRHVAALLKTCEDADSSGYDLRALLEHPAKVARKIFDWVQNIFMATTTSDPDFAELDRLVDVMDTFRGQIDGAEKDSERIGQLARVSRRMFGLEEDISKHPVRRFLKEGPVTIGGQARILVAFSDVLFVGTPFGLIERASMEGVDADSAKVIQRIPMADLKEAKDTEHSHAAPNGVTLVFTDTTKEPIIFNSPTSNEKYDWLLVFTDSIKKTAAKKVFGVTLEQIMQRAPVHEDIPPFMAQMLQHIEKKGLDTEGLFRISGSVLRVRESRDLLNQGATLDWDEMDVHTVVGVMQLWFRELVDPLLTNDLFSSWIASCTENKIGKPEPSPQDLHRLVGRLPRYHRFLLQRFIKLLVGVASYSAVNKMRSSNLSIVVGPTILYKAAGPSTTVLDLPFQQTYAVVQGLIDHYGTIFADAEKEREQFVQAEVVAAAEAERRLKEDRAKRKADERARRERVEQNKKEDEEAKDEVLMKQREVQRLSKRHDRERKRAEERAKFEAEERLREETERINKMRDEEEERRKRDDARAAELRRLEEDFAAEQKRFDSLERAALDSKAKKLKEIMDQEEKDRLEREEREKADWERRRKEEEEDRKQRQKALDDENERDRQTRETKRAQVAEAQPKCAACQQPIADDGVTAVGHKWHSSCFKCSRCSKAIAGSVSQTKDGKLLCSECVAASSSSGAAGAKSTNCATCGKALSGKIVRVAADKAFHQPCFVCTKCKASLAGGYLEADGGMYCQPCASSL